MVKKLLYTIMFTISTLALVLMLFAPIYKFNDEKITQNNTEMLAVIYEPYLVEFDSLIHIDTNTTYISGDKVATVGNYKAITCSVENPVVIWKMYDLHADGTCDVRDLVAMKKVERDAQRLPKTNAGWMAASQLDSAYELETMRQNLIATGN